MKVVVIPDAPMNVKVADLDVLIHASSLVWTFALAVVPVVLTHV